ncbi:AAA family ATPase [Hoylesella shahii]
MKNPFKFGTIVEGEYFTDRTEELESIKQLLNSDNHLILISPRRFGKSSLVKKAVTQVARPCISLNLQMVVSVEGLAAMILKEVFKLHPWEKLKHLLSSFRVVPTISTTPSGEAIDITFQATTDATVLIEDALQLVEKLSEKGESMVVVFDEFQELMGLDKGIDKRLRAIIQNQRHVNYIFLGSQESMMTEIFERKRSPFYRFGVLMHLDRIPHSNFSQYISERLSDNFVSKGNVVEQILATTRCHPYYTQQLAALVWDMLTYKKMNEADVVEQAIITLVRTHDFDFERIWLNFNKTDRSILMGLVNRVQLANNRRLPTSTMYSSVKRLMQSGYVIKLDTFEIEDPFFARWIRQRQG